MKTIDYNRMSVDYDKHYQSEQCQIENEFVKFLLRLIVRNGDTVLDVGCGTGFGREATAGKRIRYIGIDTAPNIIQTARNKFPDDEFVISSMKEFDQVNTLDVVVSLFSIPYIGTDGIDNVFDRLKSYGFFVAVYYDRPYRNKNSVYHGRKLYYWLKIRPRVKEFIRLVKTKGEVVIDENIPNDNGAYRFIVIQKK